MNRPAIQSILVVGDGIVGRSAALAFMRALPGVEVSLLCLSDATPEIADLFPVALPAVGRFHAAIGFDELDLVRRGVAVHHLGTRFAGGSTGSWTHGFGEVGRGEGAVPFHQIWLAAKRDGRALAYDRYSPANVIGGMGKFVHPSGDTASPLASYLYGLRFDPRAYCALLKGAAKDVTRLTGAIAGIERRDDGGIASIRLAGGDQLTADLYIDCSGPDAVLAGAIEDDVEDWAAWLAAVHVATEWVAGANVEPLDLVEIDDRGWRHTATVPGATVHTRVGTAPLPGSRPIRPGRRRNPFQANILALGEAAIEIDPLHGTALSLAHAAILRAIALLPGRDCHPLELAEYNRLTALEADRARDFHALFQSRFTNVQPPETLARTLAQWRSRGRLPFFEEETFTEPSWVQMLIGLDCLPHAGAPLAQAVDAKAAATAMADFASDIAALAERLPGYDDYLERIVMAPAARSQR